jgi:hypothetical protein
VAAKLPKVFPTAKCKLRAMKLERIKDFLLMEGEFIANQEVLRPKQEREEAERDKVEDIRGTPLSLGTLEEMIDDNHAIVSTAGGGPDHYVNIMSFVDADQLEPGVTVLLHNKTMSVVGIMGDEADPMVSVMKVRGERAGAMGVCGKAGSRTGQQQGGHVRPATCASPPPPFAATPVLTSPPPPPHSTPRRRWRRRRWSRTPTLAAWRSRSRR